MPITQETTRVLGVLGQESGSKKTNIRIEEALSIPKTWDYKDFRSSVPGTRDRYMYYISQ